ncbi:MAG TPA: site-specific DNA-methyltransferase [Pyrinomonadaceae bacterium]|jgi:DNA modification methylase
MNELNGNNQSNYQIVNDNCLKVLPKLEREVDLTFLDPPFNQQKEYQSCSDDLPENEYWEMMREVCAQVWRLTSSGGAIYFMQREKNAEAVLRVLRETGWEMQNLIVWKKLTSAVPSSLRFGKSHQIIAFATKGRRPRVFNRLRIDPPLLKHQKYERENGCFVTDVWDDIRELTSGYFAGDEAFRNVDNTRFHKQQSPIALLLRIILSSSKVGDKILDPFAGTGTTAVVTKQIERSSISIEVDAENAACIEKRLAQIRDADNLHKFYKDYLCTENFGEIWGANLPVVIAGSNGKQTLFSI